MLSKFTGNWCVVLKQLFLWIMIIGCIMFFIKICSAFRILLILVESSHFVSKITFGEDWCMMGCNEMSRSWLGFVLLWSHNHVGSHVRICWSNPNPHEYSWLTVGLCFIAGICLVAGSNLCEKWSVPKTFITLTVLHHEGKSLHTESKPMKILRQKKSVVYLPQQPHDLMSLLSHLSDAIPLRWPTITQSIRHQMLWSSWLFFLQWQGDISCHAHRHKYVWRFSEYLNMTSSSCYSLHE